MSLPDFGELSSIRDESETSQGDTETEDNPQPRKPYLVARRLSKDENTASDTAENPATGNRHGEEMEVESVSASILNSEVSLSVPEETDGGNTTSEAENQDNASSPQPELVDLEKDAGMEFEENAQRFEVDEDEEENDVEEIHGGEKGNGQTGDEVEILEEDGTENEKVFHLPLGKIRKIMKTDQQTGIINKEAIVATAVLTEHFISLVAQQSYKLAAASKKKTISLNHVKSALTSSATFDFLEGCLPQLDN